MERCRSSENKRNWKSAGFGGRRNAHPVCIPSKNRGVPHISLVFREMWDTTNLNLFSDLRKSPVERGGAPRFVEGIKTG
jgi:hypothetical protein